MSDKPVPNIMENLSTKRITEFKPGDSVYAKVKFKDREGHHPEIPHTWESIFEALDHKAGKYTVRIIRSVTTDINDRDFSEMKEVEAERANSLVTVKLETLSLYGKPESGGENMRPWFHKFDGTGYALHPLIEYRQSENVAVAFKHPSYGMIGISRRQTSGTTLFGSNIKHDHIITISVKRAELDRDLHYDRFHATHRDEIVELEMSQQQFSEMITSFNMGDGVPCTIKHVHGERMPESPFMGTVEQFTREYEAVLHNLAVDMERVIDTAKHILGSKPTLTKADRELVLSSINSLTKKLSDKMPFMARQWNEQMDKTVMQAKSDIEGFLDNRVRSMGLDAIKKEYGMLPPSITDEDNLKIE